MHWEHYWCWGWGGSAGTLHAPPCWSYAPCLGNRRGPLPPEMNFVHVSHGDAAAATDNSDAVHLVLYLDMSSPCLFVTTKSRALYGSKNLSGYTQRPSQATVEIVAAVTKQRKFQTYHDTSTTGACAFITQITTICKSKANPMQ